MCDSSSSQIQYGRGITALAIWRRYHVGIRIKLLSLHHVEEDKEIHHTDACSVLYNEHFMGSAL